MKKFVIMLLILIAVLAVVLFLKMNGNIPANPFISTPETQISFISSSAYSSEDIENLILKGKENIEAMDNVYYERRSKNSLIKTYYNGSKFRSEHYLLPSPNTNVETETNLSTTIIDFNEKKDYNFYHNIKVKYVKENSVNKHDLFQSELIDLTIEGGLYITELIYLGDGELEGKDCIIVKVLRYNPKTYEIKTNSQGFITAYWIDKSTGYLVGIGQVRPRENSATATTVIKNLSFDIVKDSDFTIPETYFKYMDGFPK